MYRNLESEKNPGANYTKLKQYQQRKHLCSKQRASSKEEKDKRDQLASFKEQRPKDMPSYPLG